MSIRVVCPNGHALKVKDKYAGKAGVCPMCKEPIEVPAPEGGEIHEALDTGDLKPEQSGLSGLALQLPKFRGATADPPPRKSGDSARKLCAKCQGTVSSDATVCPHCKAFIAKL